MNTYQFYQDEKITVWQRHTFSVTADTPQEAEAFIRENNLVDGTDWHGEGFGGRVEHIQTETMFETADAMTVEENGGSPTIEIETVAGSRVADNGEDRQPIAESETCQK